MDFTKSSVSPPKTGSFLTQNKIPSEMLASYRPSSDFEPMANDYSQAGYDQTQGMMSQYNNYYQYQVPYYESYYDSHAPFSTKFPRAKNYSNDQTIVEVFPNLENLNDINFDVETISPNAQFYILRSGNDDNIHKAIKYNVWTTTPAGKSVLKQAWQEFEEKGLTPEIYLVFSVVNSNQFLGIAKMMSNVNDTESFKYWWEPCRWFGTFQLKWLFVKDIHHFKFEHIKEGNYGSSIINSRDSTPISAESGKLIIKTFKEQPARPNIFDSFEYMDRREDYIRAQRDHNTEFEQFYDECCQAYQADPEGFQPQRKSYYAKKTGGRKQKSSFPLKKYTSTQYYPKTPYNKRTSSSQTNSATTTSTKPMNLEEQFVVKTENKQKKNGAYKAKGKSQSDKKERETKDFYPQGHFRDYQDENFNYANMHGARTEIAAGDGAN